MNQSSSNSGSRVNVPEARGALDNMKFEIARELGLMDQLLAVGWGGLSAKDSGRIGGLVAARQRKSKKDAGSRVRSSP